MASFDHAGVETSAALSRLPEALRGFRHLHAVQVEDHATLSGQENARESCLPALFPLTWGQHALHFVPGSAVSHSELRVAVVFSGGQAPGGHNVVAGLFDALKILNPASQLFGFLLGPSGMLKQQYIEISESMLLPYRNQGGFDLLGSGRTKIETEEQFEAAAAAVQALSIDGVVIVGGDDSNSNAAKLAEFFLKKHLRTRVVGVPKTIDGDLKNDVIEASFGFDTASKLYSHLIGNIQRDALSAKKYYHFIKLMGRTASHIALECALNTHPNYTLIGEEIAAEKKTLAEITQEIATLIEERSKRGKDYGVILVPEGFLEFIPEYKALIQELNTCLHQAEAAGDLSADEKMAYVKTHLTLHAAFDSLPRDIQQQLLLERDPHGNVNVSKIESERLLMQLVLAELEKRHPAQTAGSKAPYQVKFNPLSHFFGYEGRASAPSCFDANYCYALGYVAALLVDADATGYMAAIADLTAPVEQWKIAAAPLTSMLTVEDRKGKQTPVIKKALVDLDGKAFAAFKQERHKWALDDDYRYPGPIQFFGPRLITDACTQTLRLDSESERL